MARLPNVRRESSYSEPGSLSPSDAQNTVHPEIPPKLPLWITLCVTLCGLAQIVFRYQRGTERPDRRKAV
jgi:hypothetical protein